VKRVEVSDRYDPLRLEVALTAFLVRVIRPTVFLSVLGDGGSERGGIAGDGLH